MKIQRLKFDNTDIVVLFFTIILFFLGVLFFVFEENSLLSLVLVICNLIFLFKFFKFPALLFLFFFSLLHSLVFVDYFVLGKTISFWSVFQNDHYMAKTLFCHFIFLIFLGNVISHSELKISEKLDLKKIFEGNKIAFYLLSLFGLFLIVFGIKGDNIITSGGYTGIAQNKSPIFEYFILIFFLMLIFAKNKPVEKVILISLFSFYVIKSLLYGGRIEVVQISLMLFLVLVDLSKEIKTYKIVLFLLVLFYFNTLFGIVRSNPLVVYEYGILELLNPINFFQVDSSFPYKSSTEGDVIQSSARLIGLVEIQEISLGERFAGFFYFSFSSIIPNSFLPDYVSLASYKQSSYRSGGGGLISSYFYVWFGYFGPVIIGFFLGLIINYFFIYRKKSKIMFLYGFCILFTFPRWHSYNPILIVKFSIYAVLLFFFIKYSIQILNFLIRNFLDVTNEYRLDK